MTKQTAYNALNKAHVHWDRIDSTHIVVFTSGYCDANCGRIEAFLSQAGFVAVSQDFDSISGKTKTIYVHG